MPHYIKTDGKTNFNSAEFKDRASSIRSNATIFPTEDEPIGFFEQSHAVFCTVNEKPGIDLPRMRRNIRLFMAFRAGNEAPNRNTGVSLTTMFLAIYPKISGGGLRGTMFQRASIICNCTTIIPKVKTKRAVCTEVKPHNTASCLKMQKVPQRPPGHDFLLQGEKERWKRYTMVR